MKKINLIILLIFTITIYLAFVWFCFATSEYIIVTIFSGFFILLAVNIIKEIKVHKKMSRSYDLWYIGLYETSDLLKIGIYSSTVPPPR